MIKTALRMARTEEGREKEKEAGAGESKLIFDSDFCVF